MKNIFSLLLLIALPASVFGQDTLRMLDNTKIVAKVLEIGSSEIKYKKFSNQDGPTYVTEKSKIASLTFANGETEVYAPEVKTVAEPAKTQGREFYDWHDNIDYINIVNVSKLNSYKTLYILPFDYSMIEYPPKSDNRYPALISALEKFPSIVADELAHDFRGMKIAIADENVTLNEGDMALRLKIDMLDMGSRSARFWVGFGAGAQKFKISVNVWDATGESLFDFTHERHTSTGRSYERGLTDEMENFAEDIEYVFTNLSKGNM